MLKERVLREDPTLRSKEIKTSKRFGGVRNGPRKLLEVQEER